MKNLTIFQYTFFIYVLHSLAFADFFFFNFKIGSCLVKIGVEKMHKDTKYVLFLDDDVRLHPGTIGALTSEMEKNPEVVPKTT